MNWINIFYRKIKIISFENKKLRNIILDNEYNTFWKYYTITKKESNFQNLWFLLIVFILRIEIILF